MTPLSSEKRQSFEAILGYKFKDPALLGQALTHSSSLKHDRYNNPIGQSYERLEFLGDRVLGLAMAEMLFQTYKTDKEGQLARRQSSLVSEETLCKIAKIWHLDQLIQGEHATFAKERPSVMADAVESVLAVVYLESGLETAKDIIGTFWQDLVETMSLAPKDPKSSLQEWAHAKGLSLPHYKTIKESGPSHDPCFEIQVSLDEFQGQILSAKAEDSSRKKAEKKAALLLLEILQDL